MHLLVLAGVSGVKFDFGFDLGGFPRFLQFPHGQSLQFFFELDLDFTRNLK